MSLSPTTIAVRAGIGTDPTHGAVSPPVYLTANFRFPRLGQPGRYDYTRSGNPTRDEFGAAIAQLEGGAGAVVTATGLAAVTLLLQQLEADELLVLPHDGYGGTWRLANALAQQRRLRLLLVDQRDPAAVATALAQRPRLWFAETPSNPLLRLTDLAAIAAGCRAAGALLAVDNTFLSPLLQQPLRLGADFVIHSTTKYLNGHSDVVGGALVANNAEWLERLRWWGNALGLTAAPFDCWLAMRGLRTLRARLVQHEHNAMLLAQLLLEHPAVAEVHYPGLPQHPDHALARRQQTGFGGMLSFRLRQPDLVAPFVAALQHFTLAESLGGVESLIAHPATMTHASMTPEVRARAGIGDDLLRLSVGIEDGADLAADLLQALQQAVDAVAPSLA